MELSREPPQLEFEVPAGHRGLDYVTDVRSDLGHGVSGLDSGALPP
jgi:hypothetical protein